MRRQPGAGRLPATLQRASARRLPRPARGGEELEEAEIGGQLLLRDATMRSQPGAQQRPEPFQRVDADLAKAVTVLVARVLAAAVAHGLMPVAPGFQARVDAVLVGVDERPPAHPGPDTGAARPLA